MEKTLMRFLASEKWTEEGLLLENNNDEFKLWLDRRGKIWVHERGVTYQVGNAWAGGDDFYGLSPEKQARVIRNYFKDPSHMELRLTRQMADEHEWALYDLWHDMQSIKRRQPPKVDAGRVYCIIF